MKPDHKRDYSVLTDREKISFLDKIHWSIESYLLAERKIPEPYIRLIQAIAKIEKVKLFHSDDFLTESVILFEIQDRVFHRLREPVDGRRRRKETPDHSDQGSHQHRG